MKSRKRIKAVSTASEVARYIIHFAHKRGSSVSNLKLQKLLYYAYGWYLALYDKLLFDNQIQAWAHGPAIFDVYYRYKRYGRQDISVKTRQPKFDETGRSHIRKFLDEFLGEFLDFSATQLKEMTHREPPWVEAREGLPPTAASKKPIKDDSIKAYFEKLHKAAGEEKGLRDSLEALEDLYWVHEAEEAIKEANAKNEEPIPWEKVKSDLGL